MRALVLLSVLISVSSTIAAQGMDFYQEKITMKVERGLFRVTGIYYVKSDDRSREVLAYPYPAGSSYGAVDSVRIYNLTENKIINPLSHDPGMTLFAVDFVSSDSLAVQISYCQKLMSNKAEYVLKSTIGWRKPLEQADYQLIVPSGLRILTFSMAPQDSIVTPEETVYLWNKRNYMPAGNFIVEFVRN
ncbi:MAG TPA: hypothetical protein PKG48_10635 [Bacteroidales bacterium]|nr:hypothetical protein [Bacteroidales bacterium]HPS62848.1 hypothetical protein [Bacteroidales bacterium]